MAYEYDVFISYDSADEDWAKKLEAELQNNHGQQVYRDQSRLIAGAQWENELVNKVRDSQHMVVLWSKNGADSDWVRRERSNFEVAITPVRPGEVQAERLMIFVLLDDTKLAYSSLQTIQDIKEAQAYSEGVDKLDPLVWRSVINKVVMALKSQDKSTPVMTVIMAATQPEIQSLPAATLDQLVNDLGLGDRQALFNRYTPVDPAHPKRTDWRPFGSNETIATILDNQRDDINSVPQNPKFRWGFIPDDFWNEEDYDKAREYAEILRASLSLIVIDPVSLHVPLVRQLTNILKKCLTNSETAVMVPMPFSMSPTLINLRKLIRDAGAPFFDEYYNPPVREAGPNALFGLNIGDERDTRRLLMATLAPYTRKMVSPPGSPYVRY
jgi:hypothetical protein